METVKNTNPKFKIKNSRLTNLKYAICILLVALVFLGSTAAFSSDRSGWRWIGAARVKDMLKEGSGLWLIDIRGENAFDAGHIEGSVNISSAALAYKKFPANKTLILSDDSLGQKAARESAESLVQKGYEKVYVLEGGIVAWKLEGYPVTESKAVARGVTADELKWAISNRIPLRIFDMRDTLEIEKGRIKDSELISGIDAREKAEKLKERLKKGQGSDLSSKLKKPMTTVLVFPASDDAERYTIEIAGSTKNDIRYLIGGYEAFATEKKQIALGCSTCPDKGK